MMKEDYALQTYTSEKTRERIVAILPFFHSYGITVCLLYSLYQGAKIMTVPKFDPKGFIQAARTIKVAVVCLRKNGIASIGKVLMMIWKCCF